MDTFDLLMIIFSLFCIWLDGGHVGRHGNELQGNKTLLAEINNDTMFTYKPQPNVDMDVELSQWEDFEERVVKYKADQEEAQSEVLQNMNYSQSSSDPGGIITHQAMAQTKGYISSDGNSAQYHTNNNKSASESAHTYFMKGIYKVMDFLFKPANTTDDVSFGTEITNSHVQDKTGSTDKVAYFQVPDKPQKTATSSVGVNDSQIEISEGWVDLVFTYFSHYSSNKRYNDTETTVELQGINDTVNEVQTDTRLYNCNQMWLDVNIRCAQEMNVHQGVTKIQATPLYYPLWLDYGLLYFSDRDYTAIEDMKDTALQFSFQPAVNSAKNFINWIFHITNPVHYFERKIFNQLTDLPEHSTITDDVYIKTNPPQPIPAEAVKNSLILSVICVISSSFISDDWVLDTPQYVPLQNGCVVEDAVLTAEHTENSLVLSVIRAITSSFITDDWVLDTPPLQNGCIVEDVALAAERVDRVVQLLDSRKEEVKQLIEEEQWCQLLLMFLGWTAVLGYVVYDILRKCVKPKRKRENPTISTQTDFKSPADYEQEIQDLKRLIMLYQHDVETLQRRAELLDQFIVVSGYENIKYRERLSQAYEGLKKAHLESLKSN